MAKRSPNPAKPVSDDDSGQHITSSIVPRERTAMDFNALLDQKVGEVEAPKIFPEGTVTFKITDRKFDKSKNKQTPFVQFTFQVIAVEDDINQDDLPQNWNGKTFYDDFYITADATKRLEEALKTFGRPEGESLRDGIEAVIDGSHYVKASIKHEFFKRQNGEPGQKAVIGAYAKA